jgi:hypothetical protein
VIIPFIGGAYTGRSLNANPQTCINLMVEKDSTTANGICLVGTSGYNEIVSATNPALNIRGLLNPGFGDLLFAVVNNRFYEIDMSTGVPVWTVRDGGLMFSTTTGPVSMVHSGPVTKQILIADGARLHYYTYVGAPAFSQIVAPSAVAPNTVSYSDGRAVLDDQNNPGRFYYTNLYDFSTITAFSFSTAEGSPDTLTGVYVDRREIYLIGYQTTEIWYNSGDPNNPYQRYQGGFIQCGSLAPWTIQRSGNTVMWLANDERGSLRVARLASNYQVEYVSTPQIEYQFSTYGSFENQKKIYAMTYQVAGHEFYVITFPGAVKTWVYDATMQEWHQWRSGSSGAHVATAICPGFYGTAILPNSRPIFIATSASNAKLYELNPTFYSDNGSVINRERVGHHVNSEQDRLRITSMQLDMEEGTQGTAYSGSLTVSSSITSGATSVTLSSVATIQSGGTLALQLDNGTIHLATVTNTTTNPVTFTEPTTFAASAGNTAIEYFDDRITMEWSKNGGQTWSAALTRHIGVDLTVAGAITQAMKNAMEAWRILFFQLGQARQWSFRFKTSAIAKIVIRGLYAKTAAAPDVQNSVKHYASGTG